MRIYRPTYIHKKTGKRKKVAKWYVVFRDHTGRVVKKPAFKDKRASEEYGRKLERDAERRRAGLPVEEEAKLLTPFGEAVSAYLEELARLGRREGTIRTKRSALRVVAGGARLRVLADVTADRLREWFARSPRGRRTNILYAAALSAACNWWAQQGWLPSNPLDRLGRPGMSDADRVYVRRAFTAAELRALLGACPPRRRAAYAVMAFSGLRWLDMRRAQVRDADLSDPARPLWRLRADAVKERRAATLPMLPECRDELAAWLAARPAAAPRDPLIGKMPERRTFRRDLRRAGVAEEDESGRRVDFHAFRYFFARELALRLPLMKVKTLMRHRDVRTTANLYAELGLQDVAEDVWTLPALFGDRGSGIS